MRISRPPKKKARIEIIPMIDTIFFLLVFFMMATLTMVQMEGIKVDLPRAQGAHVETQEKVMVTITKEGLIYVEKESCGCSQLITHLGPLVKANPNISIILNADKEASYGLVVQAMSEIKKAGISRIAVATAE